MTRRENFRKSLQDLTWGCSNAWCDMRGKNTGMHTNSTCKCLRDIEWIVKELRELPKEEKGEKV